MQVISLECIPCNRFYSYVVGFIMIPTVEDYSEKLVNYSSYKKTYFVR
jgi:hypothetical protein